MDLGKPPAYLASKPEVLGHFQHCLDEIEKQLHVDEFFGWTVESDIERADGVLVTCRAADGNLLQIETPQLIKAYGFRVDPNDPLNVSSSQVRSVSPDTCDVHEAPMADSRDPVWIIGGERPRWTPPTPSSRTALAARSTCWRRRHVLPRPRKFFPDRMHRWWTGTMASSIAEEFSHRFDGTNEDELWTWHRDRYGLWSTPQTGNFALGVLSKQENDTIRAGLTRVLNDHLVDVVDTADGPQITLRSGASLPITPGSWLVNCTGYIVHRRFPMSRSAHRADGCCRSKAPRPHCISHRSWPTSPRTCS